jgi:hypothetical protein
MKGNGVSDRLGGGQWVLTPSGIGTGISFESGIHSASPGDPGPMRVLATKLRCSAETAKA